MIEVYSNKELLTKKDRVSSNENFTYSLTHNDYADELEKLYYYTQRFFNYFPFERCFFGDFDDEVIRQYIRRLINESFYVVKNKSYLQYSFHFIHITLRQLVKLRHFYCLSNNNVMPKGLYSRNVLKELLIEAHFEARKKEEYLSYAQKRRILDKIDPKFLLVAELHFFIGCDIRKILTIEKYKLIKNNRVTIDYYTGGCISKKLPPYMYNKLADKLTKCNTFGISPKSYFQAILIAFKDAKLEWNGCYSMYFTTEDKKLYNLEHKNQPNKKSASI